MDVDINYPVSSVEGWSIHMVSGPNSNLVEDVSSVLDNVSFTYSSYSGI